MSEFKEITTQEQLDEIIGERLKGEARKYEGFDEYKEKAGLYEELKIKSDGYEETIENMRKEIDGDNENAGYKKQIAELQGKVKGYENSSVKMRIAHENGIPYELAERLSGDDEEAIKKDAEIMAKYLKAGGKAPLASTEPSNVEGKKAAMKNMLAGLKGE